MNILPKISCAPVEGSGAAGGADRKLFFILSDVARAEILSHAETFLRRPLKDADWDKILQEDEPGGLDIKPGNPKGRTWRIELVNILHLLGKHNKYGERFTHIAFPKGREKYIDSTFAWTLDGVAVDLGRKAWLFKQPHGSGQTEA